MLRRNHLIILITFLIIINEARRTIMPKIEISMLLEGLNSEEVETYLKLRRKSKHENSNATDISEVNNSTELQNSTTELIKHIKQEEDYEETPGTTLISDDYTEEITTPFPMSSAEPLTQKPLLLSEFAAHLADNIQATTIPPLPLFPTPRPTVFTSTPDETFPFMMSAAKEFIRRYLSPEQWKKLRILLKTIKEVGGSRADIHRAATSFISRVISKSEMEEITKRKQELFQTFSRRYLERTKKH